MLHQLIIPIKSPKKKIDGNPLILTACHAPPENFQIQQNNSLLPILSNSAELHPIPDLNQSQPLHRHLNCPQNLPGINKHSPQSAPQ
jgi:hypothetical protein